MARADRPEHERTPFHLFVDEFQSFGTTTFANLFSEARKYGLYLTVSHQFTQQLLDPVRAAILGNAGTLIAFRVGVEDAELLAPEFTLATGPLLPADLSDQQPFNAWIKRGHFSATYTIESCPPFRAPQDRREIVMRESRERFAMPKASLN